MIQHLRDNWPIYLIVVVLAVAIGIVLWFRWRRWFWDNIFGVSMVSAMTFNIPVLRAWAGDMFEVEFQDGPHWAFVVTLAILHFLTVNIRARAGRLPTAPRLRALIDKQPAPSRSWSFRRRFHPLLSYKGFVFWY